MLMPSKKLFYAVEAVLFIAYNAKAGPISGRDIAQRQNLSPRYLEPMLQKLVRTGILRGVRGPQGGYMLGRERRRITLADICAAVTDADALPSDSTPLGAYILRDEAQKMLSAWHGALAGRTIEQLCDRAAELQIAQAYAAVTDFAI